MSVKLLMNNIIKEDATFNIYIMDTTKTTGDLVVTLANDRGGDATKWDGITDWGDGTRNTSLTHTYATDGQYEVKTKYKLDTSGSCANNTRKKVIDCKTINKNMINLTNMFRGCTNLATLDVSNWDVSNVVDMNNMFNWCTSLTSLDVSNWDVSKVTAMNNMFQNCSALTTLDLSKWDVSKVTNMGSMFSGCSNLTTLDVSNWNTSRVGNISWMFNGCSKLPSLDLSNWDVSKVASMSGVFSSCPALANLDVSNWNTAMVTDISWIFNGHVKLITLDLSKWDVSKVTVMNNIFNNCSNLTTLDISNWDVSKVGNINNIFNNCKSLNELKLLNVTSENMLKIIDNTTTAFPYHTPYTQDKYKLYISESMVDSVDVNEIQTNRGWTVKGADDSAFFNIYVMDTTKTVDYLVVTLVNDRCGDATKWDSITDWGDGTKDTLLTHTYTSDGKYEIKTKYKLDTSNNCANNTRRKLVRCKTINKNMTSLSSMFQGCVALTALDATNWDTGKVIGMAYMFYDCIDLATLDVSKWNTSKVLYTNNMFNGCANLTSLDVSNWDVSKVTNMGSMFSGCGKLTTLDLSKWDTSNVTNIGSMFRSCSSLTTLDLSKWDTSKVTDIYAMFKDCSKLTNLNISSWDTSNVTSMVGTFINCSSLTILDVSKWNTSKVTSMDSMFYSCSKLTTLDLSKWNVTNVTIINWMFRECSGLTNLNLSNWDISSVTTMSYMFKDCSSLNVLKLLSVTPEHIAKIIDNNNTAFPYHTPFMQGVYKLYVSASVDKADIQTNKGWTVKDHDDPTYNLYTIDTTKTTGDLVVTLDNDRGGDVTEWDGITDWGDGSQDNTLTHTYATDGRYEIKTKYKLDTSNHFINNTRKKLVRCTMINKNMTDLSNVFARCENLVHVDASKWDVSNVTSMQFLFNRCESLTTVDVSNWDVSKVTVMTGMFMNCFNLITLNTTNWNTSSVTSITSIFGGCTKLTTLDVSNWDVSHISSMTSMFQNCSALTTLDVGNWNVSNVTILRYTFQGCTSLTSLDLSKWDTGNVDQLSRMFVGCTGLVSLDLSGWNVGNVTNISSMFRGCSKLRELNISNWNIPDTTTMASVFIECPELRELNLTGITPENIVKLLDNTVTNFPYHVPFIQDDYKLYVSESVDKDDIQTNKGWTVIKALPKGVIYQLPKATTFNGTSDYIDTGIKLYDTDKDWTLLLDFTGDASNTNGRVLHCLEEDGKSYPGICIDAEPGKYRVACKDIVYLLDASGNEIPQKSTDTQRFVITKTQGHNRLTIYARTVSGELRTQQTDDGIVTTIDKNLLLGVGQTISGNKMMWWKGTINAFKVWDKALSEDAINNII